MDTATSRRIAALASGDSGGDYRFCLACAALAEPWDRFCGDCGACLGDQHGDPFDDAPEDWNRCRDCGDRIAHGIDRCAPCLASPSPLAA